MRLVQYKTVDLFQLVRGISDAADLVDRRTAYHHPRVAYIASRFAEAMNLPSDEQDALLLAGMLHDIGAVALKERLALLEFGPASPHGHAELGSQLLAPFAPFARIARMVRYHHVPWGHGAGRLFGGRSVPRESHILHLADRIAILVTTPDVVLSEAPVIRERLLRHGERLFHPAAIDAFESVADQESFWLDIAGPQVRTLAGERILGPRLGLSGPLLLQVAALFARTVDLRSPFTATHSTGVAVTAEALARAAGLSETQSTQMMVAGYLHDIGKLSVPVEILGKPGSLTAGEVKVIRRHTYYTYQVLRAIPGFEEISQWAAFHHERLDGRGYPFHLTADDLSFEARIMAVADIFTAVTEDRPYRAGMPLDKALATLDQMVSSGALDGRLVALMHENAALIDGQRAAAQAMHDVDSAAHSMDLPEAGRQAA